MAHTKNNDPFESQTHQQVHLIRAAPRFNIHTDPRIFSVHLCHTTHTTLLPPSLHIARGIARYGIKKSSLPHNLHCHRDARDQKLSRKEGRATNQLRKAMAVAVWNWTQWFREQLSRSLSMRTVIPADAHAAAKVNVEVTCRRKYNCNWNVRASHRAAVSVLQYLIFNTDQWN